MDGFITANTLADMFEKARTQGPAATRKGGWRLSIRDDIFTLWRYHHFMAAGFMSTKEIHGVYQFMLRTDLAGVNKFLAHFDFPGRVVVENKKSTYEVRT